jgi:rubrerythrin
MKEYIERTAVEKFIEDGLNNPDKNKAFGHDAIEIMAEVHYMPAADVAEVRHGRWVRDKWPSGTHKLICSECGEWSGKKSRYCPSCGARMDKEDEHEVS